MHDVEINAGEYTAEVSWQVDSQSIINPTVDGLIVRGDRAAWIAPIGQWPHAYRMQILEQVSADLDDPEIRREIFEEADLIVQSRHVDALVEQDREDRTQE